MITYATRTFQTTDGKTREVRIIGCPSGFVARTDDAIIAWGCTLSECKINLNEALADLAVAHDRIRNIRAQALATVAR